MNVPTTRRTLIIITMVLLLMLVSIVFAIAMGMVWASEQDPFVQLVFISIGLVVFAIGLVLLYAKGRYDYLHPQGKGGP